MNDTTITVAADGSAGSRRALDWALDEAEQRRCRVEVVAAYSTIKYELPGSSHAHAEMMIHSTMDDVLARRPDHADVSWKVVEGEPAHVLVQESEHSRLLVMGSQDANAWWRGGLGGITEMCARMSRCPFVIVPPGKRPPTEEWPTAAASD